VRDRAPIDYERGYGNVFNGDGRWVKNWLLGLFALALAAGGTTLGVFLERLMDKQTEDEKRIGAIELGQATINGKLDLILYRMDKAEHKRAP
jgi:hypothetical protein